MHTYLHSHTDEKDDFNPLQIQTVNKEWKKGERLRILPLRSRASTAQIHLPFKSRGLSEYKRYMEDNINDGKTEKKMCTGKMGLAGRA